MTHYRESFQLDRTSYEDIKSSMQNYLKNRNFVFSPKNLVLFEEVVMNVVTHGREKNAKCLTLHLKKREFDFSFLCVDDANAFDLTTYKPDLPPQTGGLGIKMILKLSQKTYYKRFQDKNYLWILLRF